jgi:hypothetical protein
LRVLVFALPLVRAFPETLLAVLRLAAVSFAGFAAPFFFPGFAAALAGGFAFPLAARAAGATLLAALRLAARVLAADEAGFVFADVLALLAGRFAAGI